MNRPRNEEESEYIRFKRLSIAEASARDTEHDHCYEKPIRFHGLWQVIECSRCPSRIQYMIVR